MTAPRKMSGDLRRRISVAIFIAICCIVENSSLVHPTPTAHSSCGHNRRALTCGGISSFVSMMSQDGEASSSSSAAAKPSERSQRKAAQRARKERTQTQTDSNKATSRHPDAILKRHRQKEQQQAYGKNSRRRHNFEERSEFLQQSEKSYDEFDTNLDGARVNQLTNMAIDKHHGQGTGTANPGEAVIHPLHSSVVTKLEKSSTTEDVVRAIKRAQNYHDMHDIREIANFLLDEVGEYFIRPLVAAQS